MALQLDDLKPFIDWLQANPGLAAFAVFLISCAESLAIVGLFIPGTIVMPAIGSMIGAGVLPAHWIIIAAILGAVVGDNLSYWLGYHFHDRLRNYWPFNRFPKLLAKGEVFFHRYGGISVFIGRFAGPVRPIIPVIAGMLNMSPARFFLANVTSAIAWAIAYMAPGMLLGAISEQLAPHVAARLLVILAIVTFAIWLVGWILNKLWNYSHKGFERASKALWLKIINHWPATQKFILHKHYSNHKPLSIILYIIFLTALLIVITSSVVKHGMITYLDWPVFLFLRSIQVPPLDTIMAYAFNLTSTITLCSVSITLFAWLLFQKAWRPAFYWVTNIVLTLLFTQLVQHHTWVVPPDVHSKLAFTSTYPSISLAIYTAILGNFLLLSYYSRTWLHFKKHLLLFILFCIGCAAIPKLYFGFNWLSSCIASVVCAAISTWVCILFFYRKLSRTDLKPMLFIACIAGLIATGAISIRGSQAFICRLEKPEFSMSFDLDKWWRNAKLPVTPYRTNILGFATEPLSVQYAGNLKTLQHALEAEGWQVAPKPSLAVILNRIGAKDRASQLPLLPDLYHANKPNLIMTKINRGTNQMLILRLWSSQILLQPDQVPLWLGTINFHHIWHWHRIEQTQMNRLTTLVLLQTDLNQFPNKIEQPLNANCELFCEQNILKIIAPIKKASHDENND